MRNHLIKVLMLVLILLAIGFLKPQSLHMPVNGATQKSYSQESFWFYPWGKSVTHKGVDIFARKGTIIYSSTYGIVLYKGKISMGGNIVLVLGPKWRLHYYAHLDSIKATILAPVGPGSAIGTVGATGNASGKPPHLHYTIKTLVPYPWRINQSVQGWRKMFYLDPIPYLNEATRS